MPNFLKIGGIILLILAVCIFETDSFVCISPCLCTGMKIECSKQDLDRVPAYKTINGANVVDLSGNKIEEIDSSDLEWKGIEQLQYLYLNVNSIVYIHDESLYFLRNLEYLDLSNNFLDYLPPRMFDNNGRLTTLRLAGNLFGSNIPKIISNSVEVLDLSFTKITIFTYEEIRNLPNLKELNLQANNLLYINPGIFRLHPGISIDFLYNFWACNCSTLELYSWVQQNKKAILIDDPLICLNRRNMYITMINSSTPYNYKESCNIDEDNYGSPPIKELSQVTDCKNNSSFEKLADKHLHNRHEEHNASVQILAAVLVLVLFLMTIITGILIGVCAMRYKLEKQKRESREISLLSH